MRYQWRLGSGDHRAEMDTSFFQSFRNLRGGGWNVHGQHFPASLLSRLVFQRQQPPPRPMLEVHKLRAQCFSSRVIYPSGEWSLTGVYAPVCLSTGQYCVWLELRGPRSRTRHASQGMHWSRAFSSGWCQLPGPPGREPRLGGCMDHTHTDLPSRTVPGNYHLSTWVFNLP